MLKELLLSVASGVIVALVLQLFGAGRRRETVPRNTQSMRNYNAAPPRRRSFFGRVVRLVLAVGGGIIFAQAAAPFVARALARWDDGDRFERYERWDRFDRFDGWDGMPDSLPIIVLTVIGTIAVYMFLSALTRR